MSRLNVGSFRHPDATADAITLTNGGDAQINRALGLGGATYGSSGQVLTSAGSGAAPTWETVENTQAFAETRSVDPDATSVPWTGLGPDIQWICAGYNDAYASTNNGTSERTLLQVGTGCLLYTSPSPRDKRQSRMPSSA